MSNGDKYSKTYKDNLCKAIKRKEVSIEDVPDSLKSDRDIILAFIIAQEVEGLKYAPDDIINDYDLMLKIARYKSAALEYIGDDLKHNEKFILRLLKMYKNAILKYIDKSMFKNKSIILQVLNNNHPEYLKYAGDLIEDPDVIETAIKSSYHALLYLGEKNQDNEDIVLACIKNNGHALKYASPRLKKKKEIVLAALKESWQAYKYMDDSLLKDKDIYSFIIRTGRLQYIDKPNLKLELELLLNGDISINQTSTTFRSTKEMMLEAMKKDPSSYQYLDQKLKKDKDIIDLALEEIKSSDDDIGLYKDIIKEANYDFDIMMKVVKKRGILLKRATDDLKDNEMLVTEAVKQDGTALQYASLRLRKNRNIALIAVKQNPESFIYCKEYFLDDYEIVHTVVTKIPMYLEYASNSLKDNDKIVYTATISNYKAFTFASIGLKNNPDFISKIIKNIDHYNAIYNMLNPLMKENPKIIKEKEKRDEQKKLNKALKKVDLQTATTLVESFINSEKNKDDYLKEHEIEDVYFDACLEVIKSGNSKLYKRYMDIIESNQKKRYATIIANANKMADKIDTGFKEETGHRDFDLLDYYDITRIEIPVYEKLIKTAPQFEHKKMATIRKWIRQNTNASKYLNINAIMSTTDGRLDKDGNIAVLVSNEDKQAIIDWLIEKGYPISHGTYYAARKRHLAGQIDIYENKKEKTK